MHRTRAILLLLVLALIATGCSDSAVRTAYCLKAGAKKLARSDADEITRRCDLGALGPYTVVLLPAGEISDEELRRAGLEDRVLETVKRLEIGLYERVNVIPLGKQEPPSRTTYQKHYVRIPDLLVVDSNDDKVTVTLRKFAGGIEVVGLE